MEEKGTMHVHLLTELTGNLYSEESEWEEEWSESDEYGMPLDGTELADHQPVLVDGIVIQHIVFFKVNRVINKVVVYGIVPDNNTGSFHGMLEINCLTVSRPGIDV